MTSNINDAAVNAIFDKMVSIAMATGRFDRVNQHEPKSAPGNGITCSVWIQRIRPAPSGQSATSGLLLMNCRLYTTMLKTPFDYIEPEMTAASLDLMGSYSGDFLLGSVADIREIDLLGSSGYSLDAQAGYLEIDKHMYRVITITVPIIVNDIFTQVA